MKSLLKREYAAALHERIAACHMNAMAVRIETAMRNAARAARKRRKEEEETLGWARSCVTDVMSVPDPFEKGGFQDHAMHEWGTVGQGCQCGLLRIFCKVPV